MAFSGWKKILLCSWIKNTMASLECRSIEMMSCCSIALCWFTRGWFLDTRLFWGRDFVQGFLGKVWDGLKVHWLDKNMVGWVLKCKMDGKKLPGAFFNWCFSKLLPECPWFTGVFFSGHESNVKHMDQIIKLAVSLRVWKGAKKLFQGIFFLWNHYDFNMKCTMTKFMPA